MILSQRQKNKIIKHAEQDYPREACGFVLEDDIFECPNVFKRSDSEFEISPFHYLRAKDLGAWAVYHSHPEGGSSSSFSDRFFNSELDLAAIIYSVETKKFSIYNKNYEYAFSSGEDSPQESELTPEQRSQIKNVCIKNHPNESCGIVLLSGEVMECRNFAANKRNSFVIPLAEIEAFRHKIKYIFHSHCFYDDATFSDVDEQISTKLQIPYVLYNTISDEFSLFCPKNFLPYEGRVFAPPMLDCVSLVIDYYENEFGVTIQDAENHPFRMRETSRSFFREMVNTWQHQDKQKLLEYFLENGFYEVDELKPNDLIVCNHYKKIEAYTHTSIYLGGGKILTYSNATTKILDWMLERESLFWDYKFLRHRQLHERKN